jgi:hypothetical protein
MVFGLSSFRKMESDKAFYFPQSYNKQKLKTQLILIFGCYPKKGSGFSLQVLAPSVAVGFSLQSLTHVFARVVFILKLD